MAKDFLRGDTKRAAPMGALYFIATLYTNFNISEGLILTIMLTMEIK